MTSDTQYEDSPTHAGKARPGKRATIQAVAAQLRLARTPRLLPSTRYLPPMTQVDLRRSSRLLPARYSDSVLTRIADSHDDLQAIYLLDNATNERLLTEANRRPGIAARELVYDRPFARIINAAFAHPHPQGARFSTPNRGAWYAGFDLATARAEVLFHRSVQLSEIGWNAREDLDYDHYSADFTGLFHDLRLQPDTQDQSGAEGSQTVRDRFAAQRAACLDPSSYIASQHLALDLLDIGSLGVVYPSTRRPGGVCLACFQPSAVANVRKGGLYRLTWYPDAAPKFLRVARETPASPAAGPEAV